jgi:cell fate regulator YaaT (PSP1 superfamily)
VAELYLVEFKGSRKEYYYNSYYHTLSIGDRVIVQAERGEDLGVLHILIEKEMDFGSNRPHSIMRPASKGDLTRLEELRQQEKQYRREIIDLTRRHGLIMKIVDAEYQFDGNKMTVYFTAEHRIDFRELVKEIATRYRTRIELRQIGVRDEARRIGGYGICGKRQCCNTHIKEFAPISTQHAREQDLPLNPSKISGNCGRLLCCLKYEAEMYSNVKKRFPRSGMWVRTLRGEGIIDRVDYFKEEAIVRTSETESIRVRAEEILEKRTADGGTMPHRPPEYFDQDSNNNNNNISSLDDSETHP